MKSLDLLEQFDKGAAEFGFVATYEFDPQFFERRILAKRTFGSAERLVIFMDRGRYQELINIGLQCQGFNRRYLVVPMDRAPQVFHPKLYLALGDKRSDGMIGSSNCTNAGIAFNVELCSTFSIVADKPGPDEAEARSILKQIYEALKVFAADSGVLREVLEAEYFKTAEDRFPWLRTPATDPSTRVELIHSHHTPIWPEVVRRLVGRKVRKVTVLAPFYDRDLGFLRLIRKQWPQASLTVVAQPDYATLAGNKLAKLFDSNKHQLLQAIPPRGRRLHAKAFGFETDSGTFWLCGSPNATCAAFDGRNTEAALWIHTKERSDLLLRECGFETKKIHPSDFTSSEEQEPRSEEAIAGAMALVSAVLSETGTLECELESPFVARGLSVRVRNANEAFPVFSIPVRGLPKGKVGVHLDEIQIAQIRGAAVCELSGFGANGEAAVSNPVALVQLFQLLRERPVKQSGRDPLRRIEESGEDLIPYVDGLGSARDAIRFFNSCNIRFFDGESSPHQQRRDLWKPRDPFKPDTPPSWLNLPAGGTAEELRNAILEFVERHQRQKLYRHVRRGNVNGLANFLDIFRTLNGLLLAYHGRILGGDGPIIPFGFVTYNIMTNVELLIGPMKQNEEPVFEGDGFVAAVKRNVPGDLDTLRERLQDEHVPEMLMAATEAMVSVRQSARKLSLPDTWAQQRFRWVSQWIYTNRLSQPSIERVRTAGLEYLPGKRAAA
jgi:hypothetical protein